MMVKIINQNVNVILVPTNACLTQIATQNQNAYIYSVYIIIDKFSFELNKDMLVSAYQTQNIYQEEIQIDVQQLNLIIQQSFIKAKLNITSMQGKRLVPFVYDVIVNTDYLSDMFSSKQAYLYNQELDYGYLLLFQYKQQALVNLMQQIDNLQYDYVEYRLTLAMLKVESFISQTSDRFNESLREIRFSCLEGTSIHQKTCTDMRNTDLNALFTDPSYNLDIMFIKQGKMVYLIKVSNMLSRYTCWNNGLAIINNSGLTLQLASTGRCNRNMRVFDYSNIIMWLTIRDELGHVVIYNQRYKNVTQLRNFHWGCSEINCSALSTNQSFMFAYTEYMYIKQIIVTKVQDIRGKTELKTVFKVISGFVLVIVFGVAVYKQKMSVQVVNSYRGGPRRKRPGLDDQLQSQLLQIVNKKFS
ncbi:Conserved_hypothetical protein [Hexamita inflata]|uniref:Transmembrane protein n=1 Tax=Hexamita inflata TaxID=28002 RepID=A0AA86UTL3_9EUKA|nr:Conserved hypothetical protein [Hexamita inflata]